MADPAAPSTRTLGANTVFATISAASAVFLLALQSVISQVLGEEVSGRFSWALTLAMLGEALMDLGVHQITIRSIARDPDRAARLFHNSLALKAVTGAIMFVVMGGLALVLAGDRELWYASLLMLGVAILRSYILTIRGVLQGLERFGRDCLVVVGDRVLVLVVATVAIWKGAGLLGVALAFGIARVIAMGGALLLVSRQAGGVRFNFDLALWRELQRQALPIGMFLVVLNFYSYIDTTMLGVMSTFVDTGLYSSAYRLYEGFSYAPAILSALLTPRLSALWKSDATAHIRLSRQAAGGAAALAVLVSAPAWYLSTPLLVLVFGPEAAAATPALHLLIAGLVPVFVIWILHAVAISVFKEQLLLRTTAIGAVVNAGLNLWLIPRYGRDGAAFATVAGETLTLVLLMAGLRQFFFSRADR